MTTKDIEEEVKMCLENELRLYNKIGLLCLKLMETISGETDFIKVENIMSEKIRVRDEIEKMSIKRREFNWLSVNNNEAILKLTGKLRWIINKIIEYEKECESKLVVLHKDAGERLLQINKGFQMTKSFPKGFKAPSYLSIKL